MNKEEFQFWCRNRLELVPTREYPDEYELRADANLRAHDPRLADLYAQTWQAHRALANYLREKLRGPTER